MTAPSNEIISIPPDKDAAQAPRCSFELCSKLGEGTFGTVRLGKNIQTGEEVAVKILEKVKILQLEDKTRVEREIKILKCLRHANIVHLYNVIQTESSIYLIMEYVKGKELFDYIIENKRLSELEACKFYQQIISGVEYLHKLEIVHRDLKPENLLLDEKTKDLKIVDFGLSNLYSSDKGQMLKSACGSPCYAAPEMLNGKEYKAAPIDIWSSGIILYAMLCGYLPFEDDDNEELYKKICEGKFTIPKHVSEQAKDLIKKVLTTDPDKRISIYQIKLHPWFNLLNPVININEGLLINKVVIPVDEAVVNSMASDYGFTNKEEIRASVLSNRHNDIATVYYLLMRKKIKAGKKSIADLKSNLFIDYIRNPQNLFRNYGYDFEKVIECRKEGVKKESEKSRKRKDMKSVDSQSTNPSEKFSPTEKLKRTKGVKASSLDSGKSKDQTQPSTSQSKRKETVSSKKGGSLKLDKVKVGKINLRTLKDRIKKGSLSKERMSLDKEKESNNKSKQNNIMRKFNTNSIIHNKKGVFINTSNNISRLLRLSNKTSDTVTPITTQQTAISIHKPFSPSAFNHPTLGIKTPDGVRSKIAKSPIYTHCKTHTSPLRVVDRYNLYIPTTDVYSPLDLRCVSFKPKREIKENIHKTLKKLKIKYRMLKSNFVIENWKEDIKMEIRIDSVDDNCFVLKFKRILGNYNSYSRISNNILNIVEL